MPGNLIYGMDPDTGDWVPLICNAAGKLIIDPSEILENPPTDNEEGKAPSSNWAHDFAAAYETWKTWVETGLAAIDTGMNVFLYPKDFTQTNCILTHRNNFSVINMRDNLTPQIWGTTIAPKSATGIEKIELWYYCVSTGNLYMLFRVSQAALGIGEDITNDETDGYSTYSGTPTHLDKVVVPAAAYDGIEVVEGDLVGIHAIRASSNASDTYNADMDVFGISITFS